MSVPTTAIQIQMMQDAFARIQDEWRTKLFKFYNNWMWDVLTRKVFLRRPYTDDMFQMLADLGIEPPKENWNLDKITIRLK